MLIDWFTVGAQIVNFLVLVWLLKRFLYQPILDAIDKRERRIADELADADAKKLEARQERDKFTKKNVEFDQQRNELLMKATAEVKARRQQMLDAVQRDTNLLRTKHQEMLNRDWASLQVEITRRTQDEVFDIARHALTDLAGVDLEERICTVFLSRLRGLDDKVKQTIRESEAFGSDTAVVRSAFELSSQQHEQIQATINEVFSTALTVRFESEIEVGSGIEVKIGGQKIAWSIGDYLASLQSHVADLFVDESADTGDVEPSIAK